MSKRKEKKKNTTHFLNYQNPRYTSEIETLTSFSIILESSRSKIDEDLILTSKSLH